MPPPSSDHDKQESAAQTSLPTDDDSSVRAIVGETMHSFSDVINENLVAARFGVFASVALLTAYGISNTPLFFRFRTVADIPSSYFLNRRRLYGRVIGMGMGGNNFQISIRHLSPVGSILPKSWFDFFMKASPMAQTESKSQTPEESKGELLRVKIAGIQPPPFPRYQYKSEEYLERLVKDKTLVSLQLLARQIPNHQTIERSKRNISDVYPNLERSSKGQSDNDLILSSPQQGKEQVAICKLTHRPTLLQLFATDIAESLVRDGNATVSSSLIATATSSDILDEESISSETKKEKIIDASLRLDDLRRDATYLEKLAKAEFDAVEKEAGIWAFPEVRETKRDIVEEIEFQKTANIFQKLWRRLRG